MNADFNQLEKGNAVCYNPLKGLEMTKKIISELKEVEFIPLTKMTEKEVLETLCQSKVYIDFGHHPGKDRIPREAAMCGNCIVTSSDKGASAFNEDMPIPDHYKFTEAEIEEICSCILDCLKNYDQKIIDFEPYRQIIRNQKKEFNRQVRWLFH